MLAARVEPKNGTWKRMKKPAGQICKAIALASLLPHVTTDHPCALSGSTRFSAGGFVLVSVKVAREHPVTEVNLPGPVAALVAGPKTSVLHPPVSRWRLGRKSKAFCQHVFLL
jgi:hypothetical protein